MDEDVARLGEGEAKIVGDRRRIDRAERRAERVGELVDRRDADIEAQPLDIILDLGQRPVRDLTDAARLLAEIRRRIRPLRPDDALDLAGQAPKALRTPASVQMTSRSGGESDSMNQRAVSAP